MKSQLWWNGPQFLLKAENDWPRTKIEEGSEVKTEARKTFLSPQKQCFVSIPVSKDPTWKPNPVNWSSWTRVTRVSCCVVRFITNCRARREDQIVGPLTPKEIQNIEVQIIRDVHAQWTDRSLVPFKENELYPRRADYQSQRQKSTTMAYFAVTDGYSTPKIFPIMCVFPSCCREGTG